jgi:hypothetical protein
VITEIIHDADTKELWVCIEGDIGMFTDDDGNIIKLEFDWGVDD